jgi:hypothetical protein
MTFRLALLTSTLLAGCASFAEVDPADKHGTLHIRVVHFKSEETYEDEVRLDRGRLVPLRGHGTRQRSVRVTPGEHRVHFSTRAERYELADVKITRQASHCVDMTCSTIPVPETRTQLVPARDAECTGSLAVEVGLHADVLALFVVGPEGGCEACSSTQLDAMECEAQRPLDHARDAGARGP